MTISRTHRAFNGAVRLFERTLRMISEESYLKIAAALVNELDLTYTVSNKNKSIRIKCVSETARIRAREMLSREPDTLAWIEAFEPDDVFWDIGSNIGVYTLYAAIVSSVRVVALDPFSKNFLAITENIACNGLTDIVQPFCIALLDKTRVVPLHVTAQSDMAGGAGNPVDENIDHYGRTVKAVRKQQVLGYSIDSFLDTFDVPFPNHIKIDVDGKEDKIIAGAQGTLCDCRLRSLMIELSPSKTPANREIYTFVFAALEKAGFKFVKRTGSTPNTSPDPETSVTNNFFAKP